MSAFYRTYRRYLKELFPCRVFKIGIDAGFTCPNIDGTVTYGGCTFCDNKSFSQNTRSSPRSVRDQVLSGMAFYRRRYHAQKFIVYFQAFTNTHGPLSLLKRLYDEALALPDVVGLSIGTRPDCVPEEVLDLLLDYAARGHLWVEYGIQSIHDATMAQLNRGHTYAQFIDAVERTKRRGFPICAHVILGLPGENHTMMMQTAEAIAGLGLEGLKIHHFYIAKNTALEKVHRRQPVKTLSLEEYVPLACDFIERLPPHMVIERVVGELNRKYVTAPLWGKTKSEILKRIDQEFARRGSNQGARYLNTAA